MCDDLFDDENGDELLERSWKKNIDDINKEGYRDGVDVGREESVQEGFNEAFSLAATLLFQLAKLRGTISGQLSVNLLKPGTLEKETESQLQNLLQDVCLHESEFLTFSKSRFTDLKTDSSNALAKTEGVGENNDEKLKELQGNLSGSSETIPQDCGSNKPKDTDIETENYRGSDPLSEERQGACDMTGKGDSEITDKHASVARQMQQNSTVSESACKPYSDDQAVLFVAKKSKLSELTEKYKIILGSSIPV